MLFGTNEMDLVWEGELGYKWFHSKEKDFYEQSYAYIVLSGKIHYGSVISTFWMNYDEPVWYYCFKTEDGVEFDLSELDDFERNKFSAWGYCAIEKPQLTNGIIEELIGE